MVVDVVGHLAVALVGARAAVLGRVDRQLQVVRADAIALGVAVGERPADEHLVVGEVQPVDEHAGAERDLLALGEEVPRGAVERHRPHVAQRELVLRPRLRVVERVEVQLGVVLVAHQLHEQVPLRVVAGLDRLVEVLRVHAELAALHDPGVVLGPALDALLGVPVVLDQDGLAGLVDPLVRVDAEALHRPVAGRDAARAEDQRDHVQRLGRLRDEVEDPVGDLALEGDGVRLLGVDEVGELDRVADEEDADVVADEVPVAVLGVELHREAARVADRLGGVAAAGHGAEPDGELGLLAGLLEELRAGELRDRLVADLAGGLELAERGGAARVDDPLGDPLAVEVAHLLEEVVVLERGRAAGADRAQVLVVVDRMALTGGEGLVLVLWRRVAVVAHAVLPSRAGSFWQEAHSPQ